MRLNSINQLGKGAWKLHSELSLVPKIKATKAKTSPLNKQLKALAAETSGPHGILWQRVLLEFGSDAVFELENTIPNRKFSIDIALPKHMLAIEVDGWEFHGKHKEGFHKDRERQNLLTEYNWRILRFTAKEIYQNIDDCIATIKRTIANTQFTVQ